MASENLYAATLAISNQCFEISPVKITVLIDGQVVVQEAFDIQDGGVVQHHWRHYALQLTAGEHVLSARTTQPGKAQLETSFDVTEDLAITLAFWCDREPGRRNLRRFFTLDLGPQPGAQM